MIDGDVRPRQHQEVVRALQEIESKVDDLIRAFGEDNEASEARRRAREIRRAAEAQEAITDGDLLEGPQLPNSAVSQDDIDALFNSLD